ncbi:MAG TPA: DUF952 domain-containing protein [Rhizomicrobium sp.]
MLIFKICHRDEWREAEATGIYQGSAKDSADGFLHFSTAEQLTGTLTRYYADAHDLVLVAVDADTLGSALKSEPSRDGALFPHLYGALPLTAVKWARNIGRGANGRFILPLDAHGECA